MSNERWSAFQRVSSGDPKWNDRGPDGEMYWNRDGLVRALLAPGSVTLNGSQKAYVLQCVTKSVRSRAHQQQEGSDGDEG